MSSFQPSTTEDLSERGIQMLLEAMRYRWLRLHPAFETESTLGGLTPEQYDALVDKCMSEWP